MSENIVVPGNEMIIQWKTQTLIAIEYLCTQNKGFVHLHTLFKIGLVLNEKLFEVFRPFKPGSFSIATML